MTLKREIHARMLDLLEDGCGHKEVAAKIGWKHRNVEWHLEDMRKMFQCRTTTELVGKWIKFKLSTVKIAVTDIVSAA